MSAGNSLSSNEGSNYYSNTIAEIKRFLKIVNSQEIDKFQMTKELKNQNNDFYELDNKNDQIGSTSLENYQSKSNEENYVKNINEIIDDLLGQKISILNLELSENKSLNENLKQSLKELQQKSKVQQNQELNNLISKIYQGVELNGKQSTDVLELQSEFEKLLGENLKSQIDGILSNLKESVMNQKNEIKNLKLEIQSKNTKLNQNERLSAIGELTSRVAHDLRNPLSVMKGSIDLLKIKNKVNGDESISRHYEIMDRAISRMSAQIEDVLDFIRPIPLKVSKNSLLETIKHSMEKAKIDQRIKVELPQNDFEIEYDDKKLDVVFDNLLTNAKQAIEGEGKITINLEETADKVIIKIQDSGAGIPEDIIDTIFDPLVTTKQTGTGLGLASCIRIIQEHKGSVSVKNDPTVFTIILPKTQKSGFST